MKILGRCILGAFIVVSAGSGLLLGTQAAGAAPTSTPPTVTSDDGHQLSTAGGSQNAVQVYGTNFVDVTAIDFGGVPGTNLQCSEGNFDGDQCDVDAPPRATAGTVFVTVTAAGGTSATYDGNGDEATYYYPTTITATPALLSLSPLHLGLFTLTATVTGVNGVPLPGMTVYFATETSPQEGINLPVYEALCTTTTNASGVATCSALTDAQTIIKDNGYVVFTPGSATQLGVQVSAPLLSL